MSATMPNARVVADWLGARLYETTFRPVPLAKYIKVQTPCYNAVVRCAVMSSRQRYHWCVCSDAHSTHGGRLTGCLGTRNSSSSHADATCINALRQV